MPVDRSYVADNDRERRRLEALVAGLDDAGLSRPMPAGWTVAGVLLHLRERDQSASSETTRNGTLQSVCVSSVSSVLAAASMSSLRTFSPAKSKWTASRALAPWPSRNMSMPLTCR